MSDERDEEFSSMAGLVTALLVAGSMLLSAFVWWTTL